MSHLRNSAAFIIIFLFSISCSTEDPAECITAFDCDEGFVCIDGYCVDDGIGDTGDSGNTGDTGNSGNTGDSGNSGNTGNSGDTSIPDEDAATVDNETADNMNDETIEHDDDVNPEQDEDVVPDEDNAVTCDSGYESNGTNCVDINECVKGTDNCHENADCANTEGSFTCTCKTNYSGNGVNCTPDTKTNQSCTGLPENAQWNTAAVINQTWNGSDWIPSTTGAYNVDASLTECRFMCKTNYGWNGTACVASVRYDQACQGIPSNASWNTVSSITQAWSGTTWIPTTTSVYNEIPSTEECRFKCNPDYHWEPSSCVFNTRTNQTCTGLPENAQWNTAAVINQTWNGTDWIPSTIGTYNVDASVTECRYQCSANFYWNDSACVQCIEDSHCNAGAGEVCYNNQCTTCVAQTWNFSNTTTGRTGTIQSWTVPSNGTYRITAYGAQGAGTQGGLGAKMIGNFNLTQNTVIDILVGQRGATYTEASDPARYADGGGGGTFVIKQGGTSVSDIYVIAGGGGGSRSTSSSNRHAVTATAGKDGVGGEYEYDPNYLKGGTNGSGGNRSRMSAGGGGFNGNGVDATNAVGGLSFLNGGTGGTANNIGHGGYGGGGGAHTSGGSSWGSSCGGGGGYSGGGGGHTVGGGGGSYNNGANQDNTGGNRSGHGYVEITRVCE